MPATVRAASGDDLLGLWGAEPDIGPQLRGELQLERRGRLWSARVGGFEAIARQEGDSVVIAFPGGQGTLRIWSRLPAPEAYWVQPAGIDQPFATPVRLRRAGVDRWCGMVQPIAERFPLSHLMTRADSGALRATFRNPEANWPGRTPFYTVRRAGQQLQFLNPRTGGLQWSQPYDSAQRTIAFDFGAPIILTPRTREQAVGFVTRSPSLPAYTYRVPALREDGWRTANAASVGMNAAALEGIVRALIAVDPVSETEPRVHALLVARNGRLVLDEYFRGYDVDQPHDLRSASKTMTSIMLGAAMQQGATLDGQPLGAATAVSRDGMTLGHLLSHSGGLADNDDDEASPGNEDTMQSQTVQRDWYAFFMALPRLAAPGSTYSYCLAGINMAGGVIARATGQWIPRLFERQRAAPMSFGPYGINLMPTGQAYSGGGMRLLPRELLKFGQLYLNRGLWKGARLVPSSWVRTSTAHVIDRVDGSTDGYGWHRYLLAVAGKRYQTYAAGGNGGQILLVVPELQLTIAVTAGNYGQYSVWKKIIDELVPAVIATAR